MGLTQEQIEQRRNGISATDAVKIIGASPFGSPLDVYLDKVGEAPPFVETDRVKWGHLLEEPIRRDYAERRNLHVGVPGTLKHGNGWSLATPDGICMSVSDTPIYDELNHNPSHGLEIKTHSVHMRDHYGDAGTDEVPRWVYAQCVWNIFVARSVYGDQIEHWDIVAFLDGVPTDYRIDRDAEIELRMVDRCEEFWRKHVLERRMPEPDGSDSYNAMLARQFPTNKGDMVKADAELNGLLRRYKDVRGLMRTVGAECETIEQRIKLAIGDNDGIEYAFEDESGKVTWKRSKASQRVDYKGMTLELKQHVDAQTFKALTDAHSHLVDGSRRLVVPRGWPGKR